MSDLIDRLKDISPETYSAIGGGTLAPVIYALAGGKNIPTAATLAGGGAAAGYLLGRQGAGDIKTSKLTPPVDKENPIINKVVDYLGDKKGTIASETAAPITAAGLTTAFDFKKGKRLSKKAGVAAILSAIGVASVDYITRSIMSQDGKLEKMHKIYQDAIK